MTDTWGDGANGNSYIIEEAPAGTWSGTSGPVGTYVGGINDGIGFDFGPFDNNGDYSDWLEITLQPNKELRMVWDDCSSWCTESGMEYGEIPQVVGLTWVGPDIHNNVITNTGFEPNAYGIRIENCDMTQYHISTISNTINIGQDALVADSCTWIDQSSTLTGTDQVGSVGFNTNLQPELSDGQNKSLNLDQGLFIKSNHSFCDKIILVISATFGLVTI